MSRRPSGPGWSHGTAATRPGSPSRRGGLLRLPPARRGPALLRPERLCLPDADTLPNGDVVQLHSDTAAPMGSRIGQFRDAAHLVIFDVDDGAGAEPARICTQSVPRQDAAAGGAHRRRPLPPLRCQVCMSLRSSSSCRSVGPQRRLLRGAGLRWPEVRDPRVDSPIGEDARKTKCRWFRERGRTEPSRCRSRRVESFVGRRMPAGGRRRSAAAGGRRGRSVPAAGWRRRGEAGRRGPVQDMTAGSHSARPGNSISSATPTR